MQANPFAPRPPVPQRPPALNTAGNQNLSFRTQSSGQSVDATNLLTGGVGQYQCNTCKPGVLYNHINHACPTCTYTFNVNAPGCAQHGSACWIPASAPTISPTVPGTPSGITTAWQPGAIISVPSSNPDFAGTAGQILGTFGAMIEAMQPEQAQERPRGGGGNYVDQGAPSGVFDSAFASMRDGMQSTLDELNPLPQAGADTLNPSAVNPSLSQPSIVQVGDYALTYDPSTGTFTSPRLNNGQPMTPAQAAQMAQPNPLSSSTSTSTTAATATQPPDPPPPPVPSTNASRPNDQPCCAPDSDLDRRLNQKYGTSDAGQLISGQDTGVYPKNDPDINAVRALNQPRPVPTPTPVPSPIQHDPTLPTPQQVQDRTTRNPQIRGAGTDIFENARGPIQVRARDGRLLDGQPLGPSPDLNGGDSFWVGPPK